MSEDPPHVWAPGNGPDALTILALHGTGGDEHDLVPLAQRLAPGANVLSPRGMVNENGMPRFFRRFGEGKLDITDLKARAIDLADFVARAAKERGFDPARVVALGYSNGANVAQGMLFERPGSLAGAILARPMLAYEPGAVDLSKKKALILAGDRDPFMDATGREALTAIMRARGATVDLQVANAGHELSQSDLLAAQGWLRSHL